MDTREFKIRIAKIIMVTKRMLERPLHDDRRPVFDDTHPAFHMTDGDKETHDDTLVMT